MLVRVVTTQTTNARIVRVVTAAIEHPVGLKANVVDTRLARQQHRLLETRVARAAKRLRQLVPTQASGIEDLRLVQPFRFHRDQMLFTWSMTRFATHTRR